jgi:hypothetical protein
VCDSLANPPALGCRVVCNTPGYCLRGTASAPQCVQNNQASACGPNCLTCTDPANGAASCNGTTCAYTCNANFHLCPDNTCASNTNTARCGASCMPCPGSQVCIDNVCSPPQP